MTFSFLRAYVSRNLILLSLTVLTTALCLSIFAPVVRAQQRSISGLQAPVEEKPNSRRETPVEVRAARGEAPLSRLYDYIKVEPQRVRRLPALTRQEVQSESESKRLRVGTVRSFSRPLNISSDGTLYGVAEGEVRVAGIISAGALYTRIHFNAMTLPAGGRVFVYSAKNPDDFYGPYEGHGASADGTFWTPPVEGDEVVIEYFTPQGVTPANDAPFQVSEISHIYKRVFTDADNDAAGACNLDVTSAWAEVAKSVGFLEFTSGGNEYACTGTLLNNLSNDQTPYLLTANHCFDQQVEAQTLRVYWFYNGGDSPPAGTPHTDGANLLSTSVTSDFSFVRLTGTVPGGLYFSGWDATPTPLSTAVTGIHHPQASHKRISFGSTISGCGAGLPGPCQNFTNIHWNSGTTEEGSSGSGLWTGSPSDPKLVGTLTGGSASCSNLSGTDYYGSFSITYPYISAYLQRGDNGPDDNLEENDARSMAKPIENGTYNNLVVKGVDEDWYKVIVVAGAAVAFKADFSNSGGNIDMQLFRGGEASPVETSQGLSDSERVISINQTGATTDYYLRVFTTGIQNNYTLTVAGAGQVCAPAPINFGQTVSGTLSASDCTSAFRVPNFSGIFYSDRYYFTAQQGQQIAITLTPLTPFNTYLIVQGVVGQMVYTDLPTGGKAGSVASFTAPNTGTYTIEASSYDPGVTATYTLTLGAQPDTVSISQEEFNVREDDGRVAITVTRGPSAVGAVTVDYFTGELLPSFDPCSKVNASASPRCDYANTMGTLNFAPGEKTKIVYVPLVDDSYAEGRETFLFYLSNPIGVSIGQNWRTFINVNDNDSAPGPNPISQTQFFIRQQYIDFLGREPDPVGWQGWQDILNNCAAGDTKCDRVEVSAGFFRSPEFQERGYFIYRFYSTLGRTPNYGEFMPDLAKVSGFLSNQQLEANKAAFVNQFMLRGEFQSKYLFITDPAYVDALLQTLGLPTHPLRDAWIAALANGTMTRAQVLRAMIESVEVYQKFYNEAFVVMQYFGYLRRNPDALYLEWIKIMNQSGGDYRGMISGFMNSNEYVQRFGP